MMKLFRKIRQILLYENKLSKYLLYAVGEIVLVVIGILIALQVNNLNIQRIEQNRIKGYAKSLIHDLESDIQMLQIIESQAQKICNNIDSLTSYVTGKEMNDLSNTDLFILTRDNLYKPFMWNGATIDELKNSGNLRFISNEKLSKAIVQYEAFSRHLDEDYNSDKTQSATANELMSMVIDLNSPFFRKMNEIRFNSKNGIGVNLFKLPEYEDSKSEDFDLLSYDIKDLNSMVNAYILIQSDMQNRGYKELPRIINDAQSIISLLKKEYSN